jgi:hypothetical protein
MENKSLADKSSNAKTSDQNNIEDLELFRNAKALFQEAFEKIYSSEFSERPVYQDLLKMSEKAQSNS